MHPAGVSPLCAVVCCCCVLLLCAVVVCCCCVLLLCADVCVQGIKPGYPGIVPGGFTFVYCRCVLMLCAHSVCRVRVFQDDMEQLQVLIDNDYRVHMQLDNLPVAIHDNR